MSAVLISIDYCMMPEDGVKSMELSRREYWSFRKNPLAINSGSSTFTTAQSYNLAGAITGQTYPSGHTTSYTYYDSTAGDKKPIGSLLTFSGNLGDGTSRTYADEILYNPQGQMLKEKFSTSTALYHNLHYNARGQLYDVRFQRSSLFPPIAHHFEALESALRVSLTP